MKGLVPTCLSISYSLTGKIRPVLEALPAENNIILGAKYS